MRGVEPPGRGAHEGPRHGVATLPAVAGARVRRGGRALPMESLVTTTARARWGHGLDADPRRIVELAGRPVSLVEIGAALAVPLAVVRGIVGDLVDGGFLEVHAPPGGCPSASVLARLLDGLRVP
ncbi:DUF742 domain-containing protein [Pseudonocardia adelaidensis]|uniref:DUF742 domain-containing protein n=1 Tax=Pseudonocardia adelaidensis TaxID=648754 RepID=UPI0031EFD2C3